ncbi:MAG: hypothetical protein ABW122_01615 [Ilumatobacteraceae bacterium]
MFGSRERRTMQEAEAADHVREWYQRAAAGGLTVARVQAVRGRHRRDAWVRPGVLHVDDVVAVIPAAIVRRADRHHRRLTAPEPVARPGAERHRARVVAASDG